MKDLVFLEYCFLFDPKNTWQHLSQFEEDLKTFLLEHGLEAQILDTIDPKSGRRVVYIIKKEGEIISKQPNQPPTPMKVINQSKKELTPKQAVKEAIKGLR